MRTSNWRGECIPSHPSQKRDGWGTRSFVPDREEQATATAVQRRYRVKRRWLKVLRSGLKKRVKMKLPPMRKRMMRPIMPMRS